MILLTGANGLLGRHLTLEADRPTHKELDIRFLGDVKYYASKKYDMVVHCAAYTNVQQADEHRQMCFDVNVNGTFNLLDAFRDTPFVYISSEYARNPVNFYSLTKRMGEDLVRTHNNFLIIRTLFKANPWPFEKAFADQFTQGDYVDVIAPLIEKEIERWAGKGRKIVYVGTGRKTIYELAKRTKPDVIPNSIWDMKVPVPKDYQ